MEGLGCVLRFVRKMKLIVITRPEFIDDEALRIVDLFSEKGIDLLHIRKPGSTLEKVRTLISQIPSQYHCRLVLHDHFSLAVDFDLYGVHLNSRNPLPPVGWKGSVSRSCHSLEEVATCKGACSYVSLSPIFDSISKSGYLSAFSQEDIAAGVARGIIDDKVYALGGVTFDRLPMVQSMGFGGAMILGDAGK